MTARIVWGAVADHLATLGHALTPCVLDGHALTRDPATALLVLVAAPGRSAAVHLARLEGRALAEVAFLETALGADQPFTDGTHGGQRSLLPPSAAASDPPGLGPALMAEFLRWQGEVSPAALARRRGPLAVVAASRLRAAASAPATLRHAATPADIAVQALRHPYAAFFAMEERDIAWRRFDGTASPNVTRAVFVSGDAVTVLPYDPRRDRVLVVEQFRAGPQARGDAQPWSIEAVAGRIDPGETPEDAARREAVEEAGLTLAALHFVARYYPSPGAVSEYLYSYVALTDLPDDSAGIFGVEDEAEDIRGHLLSLDALMRLVATGEVENAPLILTTQWLAANRARLRSGG